MAKMGRPRKVLSEISPASLRHNRNRYEGRQATRDPEAPMPKVPSASDLDPKFARPLTARAS
jgi:hypothetical protein